MAKVDKSERNYICNGWLTLLEASLQVGLRQEGATELLEQGHEVFRARCAEHRKVVVCQSVQNFVQDSFEAEIQNRLDGFYNLCGRTN